MIVKIAKEDVNTLAHELYLDRLEMKMPGTAESDWLEAERLVKLQVKAKQMAKLIDIVRNA